MTTARTVIQNTLTFRLNRLSPGETADADVLDVCLRALNNIADEWNGVKSFLFREILTQSGSGISAASGTLGTTWAGLVSGDEILGATIAYSATLDVPLIRITMAEYADIAIKSVSTISGYFAHDGDVTVYFYPVPTGQKVTLRTKQAVSDFADLDTVYAMPKGYSSALTDCLSELLAPNMNPGLLADCKAAAKAARNRIAVQVIDPAIVHSNIQPGHVARITRGY